VEPSSALRVGSVPSCHRALRRGPRGARRPV